MIKPILFSFLFLLALMVASADVRAESFDDSTLFAPPFQISGIDKELPDLIGTKGSQLCAPLAITHAFEFLKNHRQPAYTKLRQIADMDHDGQIDTFKDRVRYFFQTCNTDRDEGTRYSQATRCMDDFIKLSPYNSWTYTIGPHAQTAPPGATIEEIRKALNVTNIKYYVKNQAAVLMGVGWYKFNSTTGTYERAGGHFFNLYGYGHVQNWGNSRLDLFVVNSWIDYSSRQPGQYFDHVTMTSLANYRPGTLPYDVSFELQGTGFDFPDYKTFVEDIFVAFPYQ